jgi:hypothetical protein
MSPGGPSTIVLRYSPDLHALPFHGFIIGGKQETFHFCEFNTNSPGPGGIAYVLLSIPRLLEELIIWFLNIEVLKTLARRSGMLKPLHPGGLRGFSCVRFAEGLLKQVILVLPGLNLT